MGADGSIRLSDLDDRTRSWLDEHLFLKAYPGYTHNAYLDTPLEALEWLGRIDQVIAKRTAPKQ